MSYCTPIDIELQVGTAILVQLTNDNPEQNTIDQTVCEEVLIYSSTLIDGYLRGKYHLPLSSRACLPAINGLASADADDSSPLPASRFPLLRIIAIDLSIYRLYSRRIYTEIPETVLNAYKNAIKTLEDLKKGLITLQTEEENSVKSSGEYRVNKTENDRVFNKRVMNIEY